MEALTRLVADSLARHGLDRPVDPRRLQWSRWFRCDSPRSLLIVPSKPGIFALAEEVMDLGAATPHVETAAPGCLAGQNSAAACSATTAGVGKALEGHDFGSEPAQRRMLAVLQFCEDDDMAFTLDRMFTRINPMRDRLVSGRCFLRFVVIEDQAQRRSICAALNQWMLSSAERVSGLPPDFSSSLEFVGRSLDFVGRTSPEREPKGPSPATAGTNSNSIAPPQFTGTKTNGVSIDSGAEKNLHCPHPLPSGF